MSAEWLARLTEGAAAAAPKVAAVVGILLVGLIASRLAGRSATWFARKIGLETLGERTGVPKVLYAIGLKEGLAAFLGRLVFYAGLLVTFSAVAELLGLPSLAALSGALMRYLPRLLTALAIVLLGTWAAGVLEGAVVRVGKRGGRLAAPAQVGRVVYHLVLVVAFTVAAQQAGLDTALVTLLVGIVTAGVALAMALSFALGSREVFSNLFARYYTSSTIQQGDRVRVGDTEGEVVRYTAIALVLRGDDGSHVLVPCSELVRREVTLLSAERD